LFPSIAKRIVKYRKAGGQFRSPEDVGKIYGFPEELLALIEDDLHFPEHTQKSGSKDFKAENARKKNPFRRPAAPFDPNTYSAADWEKLGLFPSIAKRIVKYREAGGQFRSPKDVGKIYGFPEELLALIEEDIQIEAPAEEERQTTAASAPKYPKKEAVFTEKRPANAVSAEELQQLRGIGAGYSQRIVDYREKIGGFTHAAQLQEVYGLPPELVERLGKSLSFSGKAKKQLKINAVDIKTLAAHPYFSYSQAKRIVNFRKQHGAFKALKDLQKIHGLKKEWIEKVKNYLDFSP
jgi:competence ComEA-like helix-hairpin-helix protein